MPRVTTVQHSRTAQTCGKCGEEIPIGGAYKWWKFRFGGKRVRCDKPACAPRGSDLTQSEYMGRVCDIQEFAFSGESVDELESERDDIRGQIEELRDEQEEKRSNMPDSLQDSDTGNLLQERYDSCDNAANELDGVDIEEFDEESAREEIESKDKDEIEQELEDRKSEHFQTIRDSLSDALSSLE